MDHKTTRILIRPEKAGFGPDRIDELGLDSRFSKTGFGFKLLKTGFGSEKFPDSAGFTTAVK